MSVLVAKRYAKSIFELALTKGELELSFKEISILLDFFKNNSFALDFLTNPVLSFDKKRQVTESMFGEKLSNFSKSILYFIIKNKRTNMILQIFEEFNQLYRKEKKIISIDLVTAQKASEDLKDRIVKKFGNQNNVFLNEKIDKSLLGGILIKLDGKQFDSTVKNSINKIKSSFKV
tara:strand:- start:6448 stop:6975 length:528 start_codon:yes stop_codon:yes gene_type:complete